MPRKVFSRRQRRHNNTRLITKQMRAPVAKLYSWIFPLPVRLTSWRTPRATQPKQTDKKRLATKRMIAPTFQCLADNMWANYISATVLTIQNRLQR
jgi:hypothetical protein